MNYFTDKNGKEHVVAFCNIQDSSFYDNPALLIVSRCPYCGQQHMHKSSARAWPFYGTRTSECLNGEYLLVPESAPRDLIYTKE